MKDYYQIFGVNRNATYVEIEEHYNKIKKSNQLTLEMYNIYHILNNPLKREKYNELFDKIQSLSSLKIPFFAYDFDEKYTRNFIQKRYPIDNNRYLIYDKENRNGKIIKNYFIEVNGKLSVLSENTIKKLKEEYYEKKSQEQKSQEQKSPESKTFLLKDYLINTVLQK
jgi:curved DNA-binding protein CbpA